MPYMWEDAGHMPASLYSIIIVLMFLGTMTLGILMVFLLYWMISSLIDDEEQNKKLKEHDERWRDSSPFD